MKIVGIIAVVIVAALVGVYFYYKNFYDNINFRFKVNVKNINPANILSSFPVSMVIDNNNNGSIVLKNVYARISYLGSPVLETNTNSTVLKEITIPGNVKGFEINDTIQVFANYSSVNLVKEIIKGSKPEVEITVSGKIFKIPFNQTFKQQLEF